MPLPELTADTIYIQGRSGFSAVKIGGSRRALGNDTTRATNGREDRDPAETRTYTLIKVAITAQKFWKCTGLVYQGLLGGMALLHFIMVNNLFRPSFSLLPAADFVIDLMSIIRFRACRFTFSSTLRWISCRIIRYSPKCMRIYSPSWSLSASSPSSISTLNI